MNPEMAELLLDGVMLCILLWVMVFVVIFIDQLRKGR